MRGVGKFTYSEERYGPKVGMSDERAVMGVRVGKQDRLRSQ